MLKIQIATLFIVSLLLLLQISNLFVAIRDSPVDPIIGTIVRFDNGKTYNTVFIKHSNGEFFRVYDKHKRNISKFVGVPVCTIYIHKYLIYSPILHGGEFQLDSIK
jgi:hypothetical protein